MPPAAPPPAAPPPPDGSVAASPPAPAFEPVLEANVLRGDGARLRIALVRIGGTPLYALELARDARVLLRYWNDPRGDAWRARAGGDPEPYVFRSIEQTRYDFEREARAL